MIIYPIVYLKRLFNKMLPKGMYQIARIEFQKCNFLVRGGAHPPSDTSLSTQARNVVLVLHFGHCLYSTPALGEKQSWICLCLSFVPFMLGLIKENVYTKYDLRKFFIVFGVCIKIRTCRSEQILLTYL